MKVTNYHRLNVGAVLAVKCFLGEVDNMCVCEDFVSGENVRHRRLRYMNDAPGGYSGHRLKKLRGGKKEFRREEKILSLWIRITDLSPFVCLLTAVGRRVFLTKALRKNF